MTAPPAPRLKLNVRLLPWLVGLLAVMQLIVPFRGWIILLVGLGGGWLVSYLWAWSLAHTLRLIRETRFGWAQVGDRLEERFTLVNEGWAPALWVEVLDHSTMPDYQISRVTGVGGNTMNRWQTHSICQRRGLFTLGPTTLQTGDPFGLYTVSLHYPNLATLTVTPPVVPLPTIQIAPGGRVGEGRPRANTLERTVSVASVREYLPGDTLNRIHWPTSAHRNEFFVRLFDSTPAGDWWIFLDLDRRVQAAQADASTEEHGVILAASLADEGLRLGRAVGLVAYGEILAWLPPRTGDGQRQEILRALAVANPGSRSLAELLARARPALDRETSLILITPAASGDWIEALWPLLRRGAVATVLLLDPVSFGGQGETSGTLALLTNLGVTRHLITPDLLDRPEVRPGQQGNWEWRIMPTGRAVPVRRPGNTPWRALT
jgi:uncharacterized protein (DUF58 family)